ncbi:unnamed protein product [Echinostoma caproni]|uniref:Phage major capsid protein n=1 Tax=Echinostoma caproni TaxID=27848 RepID=A0A183BEB6_9TREM|nr:unnamed protein product [Echinostoma caproni]
MDENDEATGYALVAPEDAKKILSGEATLQNVVDEEGKQVLTLAPVLTEGSEERNQTDLGGLSTDEVNDYLKVRHGLAKDTNIIREF